MLMVGKGILPASYLIFVLELMHKIKQYHIANFTFFIVSVLSASARTGDNLDTCSFQNEILNKKH